MSDSFIVTELKADKNEKRFKLIPSNKNKSFDEIVLTFKNDKLKKMQLANQLGQNIQVVFSKPIINHKLDDKLFTVNIPSGVDVIDQTQGQE